MIDTDVNAILAAHGYRPLTSPELIALAGVTIAFGLASAYLLLTWCRAWQRSRVIPPPTVSVSVNAEVRELRRLHGLVSFERQPADLTLLHGGRHGK